MCCPFACVGVEAGEEKAEEGVSNGLDKGASDGVEEGELPLCEKASFPWEEGSVPPCEESKDCKNWNKPNGSIKNLQNFIKNRRKIRKGKRFCLI